MPSIIYNDDVEMYDSSYYSGTNFDTNTSDQSTPETDTSVDPYPVSDGTSRTGDGWIQDLTPSGGSGGTVYPNNPPTEKDPLSYSTKTIKEKTRIVIHDYSNVYLQNLNTQEFKFYAVYTDGTEDEVSYTEVFNPHTVDSAVVINEAYDIATAINQHFWEDANGAHITDETKEDWDDAVADNFSDLSNNKSYHNILINSLGMLLRSALNNLVSLSRSGLTIFNGLGNDISDVLASFTSAGASFREGGKTRAEITTQGLTVYDDSGSISNGEEIKGAQVAYIGIDESGKPFSRIGKSTKSYIEIGVNSNDNGYIDFYHYEVAQRLLLAHIGYDAGTDASGGISLAPYYNLGLRKLNTTIGNYSLSEGVQTTASGYVAHAEGYSTTASGRYSHAEGLATTASGYQSHAEGYNTTASGDQSHAEGYNTTASGSYSHTCGYKTKADFSYQLVCGKHNTNLNIDIFEVGNGSSANATSNAFRVTTSNTAYMGSTVVTSDRRIKTDLGRLNPSQAIDFIKFLIPHKYEKFGREELGFFAQDVEKDPNYGNVLVEQYEDHGYKDFRSLSYDGLIAPIVSVEQNLLACIEDLEQENAKLKQQNKELNDRLNYIEKMLKI